MSLRSKEEREERVLEWVNSQTSKFQVVIKNFDTDFLVVAVVLSVAVSVAVSPVPVVLNVAGVIFNVTLDADVVGCELRM